jgi:tRNA (guanine-N7-)-methyltransferase
MTIIEKALRPIRSYVLRQGRITSSQQMALNEWWPNYGLEIAQFPEEIHWQSLFNRDAVRVMEIGFGMGDSLVALAKAHPEMDFIGVEVHQPGVGKCIHQAQGLGLTNLKIFAEDALAVLAKCPANSLDKVLLLFPDPWPKKKHHKRRIVQTPFASLIAEKLKTAGQFHMATDWEPYAEHMLETLDAHPAYRNTAGKGFFAVQGFERGQTKFERRGQRLGHAIRDLVYEKKA